MNSRPKQKPFFERTIAGMRDGVGFSNSTSSRSPGSSRMPAYKVIPPWLSSVPRPSTIVAENPLDVMTRTGRSTGRRSQRRVLSEPEAIGAHHARPPRDLANYQSDYGMRSAETGTADETGSGNPHRSLLTQCLVQFTCEPALESVPGGVDLSARRRGEV